MPVPICLVKGSLRVNGSLWVNGSLRVNIAGFCVIEKSSDKAVCGDNLYLKIGEMNALDGMSE